MSFLARKRWAASRGCTVHAEGAGGRSCTSRVGGGDPAHNARALEALLAGTPGPYRDAVLFNASATLIVAGRTDDWTEGAQIAAEALDSGAALTLLRDWIALSV